MAENVHSDIIINVDTSVGIAEIKNLQRQISALNSQLLQSGAAQAKAAQNVQRNLLNNINATGQFAARVKTIASTTETFTTRLEKNKMGMGEYFRYAGASTKTFGKLFKNEFDTIEKVARERVKTLQTQYIKLGRDANGALKSIAVRPLALDMNNLATQTAMAAQKQQLFNQLIKQGSTNLLNFGKNTQWAGRQLMVGFSVPLAYLGTTAAKTFMKMEEQAIRFKRVYGDTFTASSETDKMIEQVRSLANEFTKYGVAAEKTMQMAADAAAMGKQGSDLLAQINQATRLSVLGGVEQEQALETTISLTNAFGIAADKLAGKINFLNAVENQTVTSIEDLTIAVPKAGPVIQQLGGDVEDLAFFLTAMKEGGINASEGANALKSGLASLINPTAKASEMLAGMGVNIRGIVEGNKGDVKNTVIDFAEALDKLDPLNRARAIEQLFGKFQFARLSTLFQNVIGEGTQAERVLKLSNATTAELAVLSERELKRIEDSPMYKFKKAIEDIKVSLVPLGEAFLKAVTPIVEFVKGFLDRFNEMGDGAKQFAVIATTVVAGIGPVLLMTFGLIANGAANLIKLFAGIRNMFLGTGASSQTLGSQTEYMTQQQLEAAAVAASLDQSHGKLIQTFSVETGAVNKLAEAYARAVVAQSRLTGTPIGGVKGGKAPKKFASGVVSVPGPKGAGDIVPAMLAPGEAVIPADMASKYSGLISGMVDGKIPGYNDGLDPISGKSRQPVHRSHLQGSLNLSDPKIIAQIEKSIPGFSKIPKDILSRMSFQGSLTADLASKFNENLKAQKGGVSSRVFDEAWGKSKDKLLSTAISGGLDPKNAIQVKNLKLIEERIGKEALALAGNANVTDSILSKATASVLEKSIKQGGTTGSVARILQNRAMKFGDYRSNYTKAEFTKLIKSGRAIVRGSAIVETNSGAVIGRVSQSRGFKQASKSINGGYGRQPKMGTPWWGGAPVPANMEPLKVLPVKAKKASPQAFSLSAILGKKVGKFANGVVSVPGPKGAGDVVPAMLSPGESVIPAGMSKKYSPLISGMVNGTIPGYNSGLDGNPKSNLLGPPPGSGQNPLSTGASSTDANNSAKIIGDSIGKRLAKSKNLITGVSSGVGKVIKGAGSIFTEEGSNKLADKLTAKTTRMFDKIEKTKFGKMVDNSPMMASLGSRMFGGANDIRTRSGRTFSGGAEVTPGQITQTGNRYYKINENGKKVPVSKDFAQAQMEEQKKSAASAKMGKISGAAGAAGGIATMAGMGMMMSGDQSGIGNTLMMGGMALSMLPMLANPIGLVVAGLAAFTGAMVYFKIKADEATRSGLQTAEAMSMTTKKLDAMAELNNVVTSSQEARKVRENQLTGESSKKRYYGQNFMESEAGKSMLSDAETMIKSGKTSSEIAKNFANQLSYAVLQGAVTQDQANSIAAALGEKLKDYSITANIVGTLTALYGRNGENLLNDPLKISLEIQKDAADQQLAAYENSIQTVTENAANDWVSDVGGAITSVSAGLFVAAGAATVTGVGAIAAPFIAAAGVLTGLVGGGMLITGQLANEGDTQENNKARGVAVQLGAEQIAQNQGLLDSLNDQYNSQINQLKLKKDAAKTDKERKDLESQINDKIKERDSALIKQKDANAAVFDGLIKQAQSMGPAFNDSIGLAIDERFKNATGGLKAAAELAKNSLKELPDGSKWKATLQVGLASGEFDPITVSNLINASKENKDIETNFNLIAKAQGTSEANQLLQLIGKSGVKTENYSVVLGLMAQYKNKPEFDDAQEALAQIANMPQEYGIQVDMNVSGDKKIKSVQEFITATKKLSGKVVTPKIIAEFRKTTKLTSEQQANLDEMLSNWDVLSGGDNKVNYQVMVDYVIGKVDSAAIWGAYVANHPEYASGRISADRIEGMMPKARAEFFAEKPDNNNNNKNTNTNTGDTTGDKKENPLDALLKKLQNVRQAAVNATGGLKELAKWMASGALEKKGGGSVLSGIEQQLGAKGYNQDFIRFLADADKKTQDIYMTNKNGVVALNTQGVRLQNLFNANVIGDYERSIKDSMTAVNKEVSARNKIVALGGMSYKESAEAAKDAGLSEAIAAIMASTNIKDKSKAIKDAIQLWKDLKKITDEAKTAQDKFNDAYNAKMDELTAKEQVVELEFQIKTNADQDLATAAQAEIDKIVNEAGGLDDLQAGIQQIEWQEDGINKKYDDRLKALDEIEKANDRIAQQQKGQLTLADALSKGDISAAAKAAQDIRQTNAKGSFASQRDLIESSREQELAGLTATVNGVKMNRKQIEEKILDLQKKIFKIEEETLEPARERVRLAEVEKNKIIDGIKDQKVEWDLLKARIDLAVASASSYLTTLEAAKLLSDQAQADAAKPKTEVKVEDKKPTDLLGQFTPAQQTVINSSTSGLAGGRLLAEIATLIGNGYKPAVDAFTNVQKKAAGGMIQKFANGGFASGTDTVPAMLTPGEFVMTKYAVEDFGADNLKAINRGTYSGDSVYNYNLNVNMSGSNLSADDVARTVMAQIKRVDSQKLRGYTF